MYFRRSSHLLRLLALDLRLVYLRTCVPVVVSKIIDTIAREISLLRSENGLLKLEVSVLSSKCMVNCVEQSVTEKIATDPGKTFVVVCGSRKAPLRHDFRSTRGKIV